MFCPNEKLDEGADDDWAGFANGLEGADVAGAVEPNLKLVEDVGVPNPDDDCIVPLDDPNENPGVDVAGLLELENGLTTAGSAVPFVTAGPLL